MHFVFENRDNDTKKDKQNQDKKNNCSDLKSEDLQIHEKKAR